MMKNFFYPVFLMLFFAPLLKANEIMIDNFEATSNVNWDYLSDQVMEESRRALLDWALTATPEILTCR